MKHLTQQQAQTLVDAWELDNFLDDDDEEVMLMRENNPELLDAFKRLLEIANS